MGLEEKASMFHDMRESLGVTSNWLCAFLEGGMGAHLRVEGLKAERVRQSLSVTMVSNRVFISESSVGLRDLEERSPSLLLIKLASWNHMSIYAGIRLSYIDKS